MGSMVPFMQDGALNDKLLNLEIYIVKIIIPYLREVPTGDTAKNTSILRTFADSFGSLMAQYAENDLESHGFYNMPLHRAFSYYITRLLMTEALNGAEEFAGMSASTVFSLILARHEGGAADSALLQDKNFETMTERALLLTLKHQSFVHEIMARKWVYLGEYLGQYPRIYFSAMDELLNQDYCCLQMMLTLPRKGQSPFDFLIDEFGIDGML